jgi:hypothetical protein
MRKAKHALALIGVFALSGCATMRDNPTTCKIISTGVGTLAGATGGGLITVYAINHGDNESEGSYNWEVAGGTMIGAAAGAGLGYLAGHFLCPEEEPPPPPPPPPAYEPPPPPPPPPTERRGG